MARFFVTGFVSHTAAHVGIRGFYNDVETQQFAAVDVLDIQYDPTLSTTVRQQILDNMIPRIQSALESAGLNIAQLIATDIEIVS